MMSNIADRRDEPIAGLGADLGLLWANRCRLWTKTSKTRRWI